MAQKLAEALNAKSLIAGDRDIVAATSADLARIDAAAKNATAKFNLRQEDVPGFSM